MSKDFLITSIEGARFLEELGALRAADANRRDEGVQKIVALALYELSHKRLVRLVKESSDGRVPAIALDFICYALRECNTLSEIIDYTMDDPGLQDCSIGVLISDMWMHYLLLRKLRSFAGSGFRALLRAVVQGDDDELYEWALGQRSLIFARVVEPSSTRASVTSQSGLGELMSAFGGVAFAR